MRQYRSVFEVFRGDCFSPPFYFTYTNTKWLIQKVSDEPFVCDKKV